MENPNHEESKRANKKEWVLFFYTIVLEILAYNELGTYTSYQALFRISIESYTFCIHIWRIRCLYQEIIQQYKKIYFKVVVYNIRYFNVVQRVRIKILWQWLSSKNWDFHLVKRAISSVKRTLFAPLEKSLIFSTSSSKNNGW